MSRDRELHYGAPVLALDFPNDGAPIWPCAHCLPWRVEVVENDDENVIVIREWHAVDCPALDPEL